MTSRRHSCYEAQMGVTNRDDSVLPDGTYDAFVVDVTVSDEVATLELTILAGEHKGEVVAVAAAGLGRSDTDLLGMPATLVVENGVPAVTIDD